MNKQELEAMFNNPVAPEFKKGRWVTLKEANVLSDIVEEHKPVAVFESGTANGYSAMWLAQHGCDIYTFDPYSRPKVWGSTPPSNIHYVEKPFSEMPEVAKNVPGKKVFFIDGEHSNSGVQADTAAAIKVISPGDVIVYHDMAYSCVQRMWARTVDRAASYVHYDTERGMAAMVWA